MQNESVQPLPAEIESILGELGVSTEGWGSVQASGTITTAEAAAFFSQWSELLARQGEVELALSDLEDYASLVEDQHGLGLLVAQRSAWAALKEEIRRSARLLAFLYSRDPAALPTEPEPDDEPEAEPVFVPVGENAVLWLLEQERARRGAGYRGKLGEVISINLPEGEIDAFHLGTRTVGAGLNVNWIGEARLELHGHPNGTTVRSVPGATTFGDTITLDTMPSFQDGQNPGSDPSWAGRVHSFDLKIRASGRSCVSLPMVYKRALGLADDAPYPDFYVRPYKDVLFERCRFVDHLDPTVSPSWGIIAHQAAISTRGCSVELHNSKEHWIYNHNPYNAPTEHTGNVGVAIGGQYLQAVNRAYEGPDFGRSTVHLAANHLTGYCRHPRRASAALSLSGSGQDWLIEDNLIYDVNPPEHSGGVGFGALVAFADDGSHPLEGGNPGRANGTIELKNNLLGQVNGKRPVVNIQDAEELDAEGNVAFGLSVSIETAGVESWVWTGNNTPGLKSLAHGELSRAFSGLPAVPGNPTPSERAAMLLDDPPVLKDGVRVGVARDSVLS